MSSQFSARLAAIGVAAGRRFISSLAMRASALTLAASLAGCVPQTTRLAGADPADPAARVAGVGYRSTIAPHTSLRPATPQPWRERNDSVTPKPDGKDSR